MAAQQSQDLTVSTDTTSAASAVRLIAPQQSLWRTGLLGAGGSAIATVVAYPLDVRVAKAFRRDGPQGSKLLRESASVFNGVGEPGVLVASVAMYGLGRVAGKPRLTAIGAHATEAIVISGVTTMVIKIVAGRQRPYVKAGDHANFDLGGGRKGGRTSLPSGHTTAAFAFASAVATDLHHWRPDVARIATPLLYGGAAAAGAARIYDDRHWVSDVVLGAGIGTIVGRLVTINALANPDNWMDRNLKAVTIVPSGQGLIMGVNYAFR